MELLIKIDKKSSTQIYIQIVNQIREAIKTGALKPGKKLPTGRELASSLNVARGTVNKAYEVLYKDNLIEIIQGSGSFVMGKKTNHALDIRQLAAGYIDNFLSKMETLNLTLDEIRELVDVKITGRLQPQKTVSIAAIDCNEESLVIFKEQFSGNNNVKVKMFLLDDILKYSNPGEVFFNYDIIITTITHFEQVTGLIPELKDKLFKVAVSPTQETVIKIATIPKDSKIGMIVRSSNFRKLTLSRLEAMNIDLSKVQTAYDKDAFQTDKLLLDMDVLIIPDFLYMNNEELAIQLHYFKLRGGKIIDFQYQLEQGSLIYIEEQITKALSDPARKNVQNSESKD